MKPRIIVGLVHDRRAVRDPVVDEDVRDEGDIFRPDERKEASVLEALDVALEVRSTCDLL